MKIFYTPHIRLFLLGGFLLAAYGAFVFIGNTFFSMPTHTSSTSTTSLKKAYMAGGCFWCTEKDFDTLPGVANVVSG
jgi:hypothetical protein